MSFGGYDFKGGNVGLGGRYNGYSGAILVEGSYVWSNEKNTSDELWPGMRHTWTWKSTSIGGGVGAQIDARFLGGESYNFTKIKM